MLPLLIFKFRELLAEGGVALVLGGQLLAALSHWGLLDQGLERRRSLLVKRSWQGLAGAKRAKPHSPQGLIKSIKIVSMLLLSIVLPPALGTVPVPLRIP